MLIRPIQPLVLLVLVIFSINKSFATEVVHVRLVDYLDRPRDGYCLDIVGTPGNLRVDLPLFVHNCKQGATVDSAVVFTEQGYLKFPGADVCVTVFGVNGTVLSGTSVLLRTCGQSTSFFDIGDLQKFDHLDNGQLQLRGSELCLAAGEDSSSTYSPFDRWRILSVQTCSEISRSLSVWELATP